MATLDNGGIIREMYAAWNERDFDRYASFATTDARMTNVPFGAKLGFREYGEGWAKGFPDGKIELMNLVAQGDTVVGEFTGRGTHTGVLKSPRGEIPATGRRVEMSFVEVYRLRNGKICEGRIYFDTGTMLAQLGLSPGATTTQQQQVTAPVPQPRH
jgi:predicted ester cyclase